MSHKHRIRVSVVVVGDVGRSPRMQYHALALASSVAEVDVVGYAGSTMHPTVREHDHIRWHFLRLPSLLERHDPPRWLFLGYALLKVLGECLQLLWLLLCVVRKPDVILVQNPPALPTLLVTLVVARLRAAKLVVDWHNFGYTMLSLRLGQQHPVVRLARWYERVVGQHANAHLCVSRAMQAALREDWGITGAVVLYDRPAAFFASRAPGPVPPLAGHDCLPYRRGST
jgi:beta-1,4-mannosyltransferase